MAAKRSKMEMLMLNAQLSTGKFESSTSTYSVRLSVQHETLVPLQMTGIIIITFTIPTIISVMSVSQCLSVHYMSHLAHLRTF